MLPNPTADLVRKECKAFDDTDTFRLSEAALSQLLERFPCNVDPAQVLLKVVVLDNQYSTRVDGNDIFPLARHIAKLGNEKNLDELIRSGSLEAVRKIWKCDRITKQYYSFATKFCSWHKPDKYPIYDSHVDACLWAYKLKYGFDDFHRDRLTYYEDLVRIIDTFRTTFFPGQFTYKELDKFFWRVGDGILRGESQHDGPAKQEL